ncbi:RluA family pseudouridine synthase [Rhizosphaericola mali]|uniref:RNA pseudouridine synthase n=1 Tax=Rhizosphaericola mali TaxID=2545455 RepID=A0A5P2G4I4_9BACT|nr:pseudouridine synthase [Rhizosphaericola mali]QES89059.1 RNA pseudouridine synthase [Rhizosphaericola mali]
MSDVKFHSFQKDISQIALPLKFTFPFYYTPHPLAILAAKQLQNYLLTQNDFTHNFGMGATVNSLEIGKMFGVLVVKDTNNNLGFLAAFSGKLAASNDHLYFVPPVFDLLEANGFFLPEIQELNKINDTVERLENSEDLVHLKLSLENTIATNEKKWNGFKHYCQKQKQLRNKVRDSFEAHKDSEEYAILVDYLKQQSSRDSYELEHLQKEIKEENQQAENTYQSYLDKINALKQERKTRSAALQDTIFQQYTFLNSQLESKSLYEIFNKDLGILPLAGAGECAAPKLLQYAFSHSLDPICMAEFWWGKSPKSEVRQHQHFYPSCRGKCEPILGHMLSKTITDEDVFKMVTKFDCDVEIVYEDEYLAVINKPENFLSVPGKFLEDSVYKRMKERYPQATGPLVVHRLDMATSGLLLIAKDKYTHELLQRQFIRKSIRKRYVAILDGILEQKTGTINLPLRNDLEDRPRQLVDFEIGRPALTKFEVVNYENGTTRIHFWPITGRTHQLRMHASHALGLNTPIVGDEFYGNRADRLYLHAEELQFIHPKTKEKMTIICPAPF